MTKQQTKKQEIKTSPNRILEILRFGLFGVIGFGVGIFLTRQFMFSLLLTEPLVFGISYTILGAILGAIGGLSLGLVIRDTKKAKFLVLAGAIGSVIASILNLYIYFYLSASALPPEVILGAVGGASFGLVFKNWKKVLIMALASGVGFYLGYYIMHYMYTYTNLLFSVNSLFIPGCIGGLSVGLTFGYLETTKSQRK